MKKILKQVAGIDVAQKELVVCLARLCDDLTPELYAHKAFPNNKKGFASMAAWMKKHTDEAVTVRYVMEATGVYHELFAYFLDDNGCEVSIVLPNKISNYMRTLDIKTVTDKTASEAIARFGLERKLDRWKRPAKIFRSIKQLTRERDQIVQERTIAKNQRHAEKAEAFPNSSSLSRINERIRLLNKQEKAINAEVKELIASQTEVKDLVTRLCTLPGIAEKTAAIIIGETNGFELIRNRRQLASYAGFDIKEKQSGTSVKGKARISKKGNRHLRKALHFPALTAIRTNERFKDIFSRLVSKHGIKMKAAVAVQRRLLEMCFTIHSKNTTFDKEYLQKLQSKEPLETT